MNERAVVAMVAIGVLALLGGITVVGVGGAAEPPDCAFPESQVDASGTEVTVEAEPEAVVTLGPSAAQTMREIGAWGKVVGVSKYADYLEGAAERRNVSSGERAVVVETVVDLGPDLVLAPNVIQNDTVDQLRSAGIMVYRFEAATSVVDVYEKTRLIGRLTGECVGAEQTVNWMQDRIGTVERAVEGQEHPDVLYESFGFTAGSETFIHAIIETSGGNNIAADVNISFYREISREIVVQRDPDWIVLNSDDPAPPNTNAYNETRAGEQNQTVVVRVEHISQPAPRIVHAITKLANAFHPEAYAAANATTTPTTATPTATGTATEAMTAAATDTASPTDTASTTETPGQPGFGLSVAVFALVGVLLAVRARR